MKSTWLRLCLVGSLLTVPSLADETPDNEATTNGLAPVPATVRSESESEPMKAAIAEARRTVDAFIKALQSGDGVKFTVKAAVHDGDEVEHLWLGDVRYKNGKFVGKIGNRPNVVRSVAFGDSYTVDKEAISDWAYFKGGEVQGGFTAKVLMAKKGIAIDQPNEGGEDPAIIGRWKLVASDGGAGPQALGEFFVEITKDTLTLIAPDGAKEVMGTIKGIRPDIQPRQMDITKDGQVGLGIYELGEGTMLLLIRNPGERRAMEFKGSPEGIMFMLERE